MHLQCVKVHVAYDKTSKQQKTGGDRMLNK